MLPVDQLQNQSFRNEVIADWNIGDTAIHSKWGNGKVFKLPGEGAGMKLTIEFPTQGVRVVMAKFAPVKRAKICVWQLTFQPKSVTTIR